MRAAQDNDSWITYGESLAKIDPQHIARDCVLDPALFNQRHQQRACLLRRTQAALCTQRAICMRLDGGGSGKNQRVCLGVLVVVAWTTGPITPVTGTLTDATISGSASAVAVLHAITR